VLPETNLAGAAVVAERIRRAVAAAPIRTAAGTIELTVSIGVSGLEVFADRNEASVEQLLRRDRRIPRAR